MSLTEGREVEIPLESVSLRGTLHEPEQGKALVIFAHGSGSSRLSPRNVFVADELAAAGLGTLLFDLLSEEEDRDVENRFNISLLADRLVSATRWIQDSEAWQLAFFGASTGAAAALVAAARLSPAIRAVVSRGGRPDLAWDSLPLIECPALLLVGELDEDVLELNRLALSRIPASTTKKLVVVPGASHLFPEPGTLSQVATAARDWFHEHASRGAQVCES